jgi:N6-adenosine-specific RNA methylase IME4
LIYTNFDDIPKNKYSIIYADPPWSYNDKMSGNRGAEYKYEVHDIKWITNLPVKNISKEDSILFLWVPMPHLEVCWSIIHSWGFIYKTSAFTWVKKNKKKDSYFWGCGNWTRSNPELCLLSVKGNPKRISASVHSVIDSKIQEHSKKPDETRNKILQLCGNLPRIELFARQEVPGWDCFGNEVEKYIPKIF